MGVNLPDLDLKSTQSTPSVADKILENSRRKGMSFSEMYWPSASSYESGVYQDAKLDPVAFAADRVDDSQQKNNRTRSKPRVSKKLSIPRENEGLIGGYSGAGSRHRSYDAALSADSMHSIQMGL